MNSTLTISFPLLVSVAFYEQLPLGFRHAISTDRSRPQRDILATGRAF